MMREAFVGAIAISTCASVARAETCPSFLGRSNWEAPGCYALDIQQRLESLGFVQGKRDYKRSEVIEGITERGRPSRLYESTIPISGDYSSALSRLTSGVNAELQDIRLNWAGSINYWVCESACHDGYAMVCDHSRQNFIKSGGSITWTLNLALENEQGPRMPMPDGEPLASATVTSCNEVN